jgi:hypothetical protein
VLLNTTALIKGSFSINDNTHINYCNITATAASFKSKNQNDWHICQNSQLFIQSIGNFEDNGNLVCDVPGKLIINKGAILATSYSHKVAIPVQVDGKLTLTGNSQVTLTNGSLDVTGTIQFLEDHALLRVWVTANFEQLSSLQGAGTLMLLGDANLRGAVQLGSINFQFGTTRLYNQSIVTESLTVQQATLIGGGDDTINVIIDTSIVSSTLRDIKSLQVRGSGIERSTLVRTSVYFGQQGSRYLQNGNILDGSHLYIQDEAVVEFFHGDTLVPTQWIGSSTVNVLDGTMIVDTTSIDAELGSRIIVSASGTLRLISNTTLNVEIENNGIVNVEGRESIFNGSITCSGTFNSLQGSLVTVKSNILGSGCTMTLGDSITLASPIVAVYNVTITSPQMYITGKARFLNPINLVGTLHLHGLLQVSDLSVTQLEVQNGELVVDTLTQVTTFMNVDVNSTIRTGFLALYNAKLEIHSSNVTIYVEKPVFFMGSDLTLIGGSSTLILERFNVIIGQASFIDYKPDTTLDVRGGATIKIDSLVADMNPSSKIDIKILAVDRLTVKSNFAVTKATIITLADVHPQAKLSVSEMHLYGTVRLHDRSTLDINQVIPIEGGEHTINAAVGSSTVIGSLVVTNFTLLVNSSAYLTIDGDLDATSGIVAIETKINATMISSGQLTVSGSTKLRRVELVFDPVPYSWNDFSHVTSKHIIPFLSPITVLPTIMHDNTNGVVRTTTSYVRALSIDFSEGDCAQGCVFGICNGTCHCSNGFTGTRCDIPATSPPEPSNFSATPYNGYIQLTWNPPVSEYELNITQYNVYTMEKVIAVVPYHDDTNYVWNHEHTIAGTVYSYSVAAVNPFGVGNKSNVQATAVDVPTPPNLSLLDVGMFTVSLAWTSNVSYPAITSFELYRNGKVIFSTPDKLSYIDKNVDRLSSYQYDIIAVNERGKSKNSTLVVKTIDTPGRPTNANATQTDTETITVEWDPPTQLGNTQLLGYKVFRDDKQVKMMGPETTTMADTGLEHNHEYVYAISAFNKAGDGPRTVKTVRTVNARYGLIIGLSVAGGIIGIGVVSVLFIIVVIKTRKNERYQELVSD